MNRRETIDQLLNTRFSAVYVNVVDESNLHAGHADAQQGGETHFSVTVVSDSFIGKTLIERHRLIYDALQSEIKAGIHALRIKACSPDEWQRMAHPKG
ncbi:MAG: BolA family transcriptional regulator [Candidatus Omnitrophica bacterium]|nr:BolA family transcriptional regulator [Candidatus Omnitrophota bacterium]